MLGISYLTLILCKNIYLSLILSRENDSSAPQLQQNDKV